jgi:hypothetical protein
MAGESTIKYIAEIQTALDDLIKEHNRHFESWRQSMLGGDGSNEVPTKGDVSDRYLKRNNPVKVG